MSWDNLRSDIKGCVRCDMAKTRKNVVIGRGSSEPLVAFVGEAPGENEDDKGIPFCGRAGQVLDSEIKRIGLSYNSYYIVNIVKCRPITANFKNRKPTENEINSCYPFLVRQLLLLKPNLIVFMGESAKSVMYKLKDDLKEIDAEFYGIVHPAATLYRPKLYLVFRASFDIIKGKLSDKCSDKSLDKYGKV